MKKNKLRLSFIEFIRRLDSNIGEKKETKKNEFYGQKRLALVIGCSEYELAGRLSNPTNDSENMKKTLESLGF